MTQRRAAIQSRYHKEIKEFTERMADAREEGNNILCHIIIKIYLFFIQLFFRSASFDGAE
jgi:hypothetical protein